MYKKIPAILLVVLMLFALTSCGKKEGSLKLGTAGTGGNYYSYGTKLAEAAEAEDLTLSVTETAGSAANVRLISDGYLDLALVQSDVLSDAMKGEGSFENALDGFHVVTGLFNEAVQVVTLSADGYESVADLKGKKVSLGEKDSGAYKNALDILAAYGLKESDVNAVYENYENSAQALKAGEIAAFFCTASYPTTAINTISEDCLLKILPVDAGALTGEHYSAATIPAGTYKGIDTDVTVAGIPCVLIANDKLDKSAEDKLVSILKTQNEDLQEVSFGVAVTEKHEGTFVISLDMYMTLTLAVLVLYLGKYLRKKIKFFDTFCIPAPVIGGLIFAILSCVLFVTGVVEFEFDETIKNICMIMFFTSVGFQANLKILKKGGLKLVIFLLVVTALILCQNGMAVGLARLLGIDKFIGLCTGSIPMVGGHGTSGAFGQVLEDLGLSGATTLCTAAATFGLVAGSLMGGPIGRRLIIKNKLLEKVSNDDASVLVEDEKKHIRKFSMYAPAAYQLSIAMGIGTVVSELLSKTGMTFPVYIGAMIVAAIIRNVGEYSGKYTVHMGEINDIGGICLSLFLGIAMITLKLWQLADLALPLVILLTAQTVFMFLFSYFVVFNVMGRNYDAAVLAAGTCGFGMGATPNAMANMQAITEKFVPSIQAYILVPIVGSMFADFINSIVITFFINIV
ncbi:MAG: sodium/glutamate symporter [Clostridia bacterium]|nr:sodium/glutamate symporter [Clostridia bacterium]